MARLTDNTVVLNPDTGAPVQLAAGVEVPRWAKSQIGDHLLDEQRGARQAPDPDGSLPPKSGNGSSQAAWLAYARNEANAATLAAADIVIPDDAKQSEIIAALETAKIPTERAQS
jgi:hypothetical protein